MTRLMCLHLLPAARLAENTYRHQCVAELLVLVNLWDAQAAIAKTFLHFVSPTSRKIHKNLTFVSFSERLAVWRGFTSDGIERRVLARALHLCPLMSALLRSGRW